MRLKRFLEYRSSTDIDTLGTYVLGIYDGDDRIREIVNRYIVAEPYVNLQSSIDSLDDEVKTRLQNDIEQYLNGDSGEVSVIASVPMPIEESWGRGVFDSFLKCLTSLGLKENKAEEETPKSSFVLFKFPNLNTEEVKEVFSRYKSLRDIELNDKLCLYYKLDDNMVLDYGVYKNGQYDKIGIFKLTKRVFDSLKISSLKSLSGYKKFFVELEYDDLKKIIKLKQIITGYNPGVHQTTLIPKLNGKVITFGWKGYGTWVNGVMDTSEISGFKEKVRNYLLKTKIKDHFMISVNADSFWIYLNFRLK